jgi:hypothetical protein
VGRHLLVSSPSGPPSIHFRRGRFNSLLGRQGCRHLLAMSHGGRPCIHCCRGRFNRLLGGHRCCCNLLVISPKGWPNLHRDEDVPPAFWAAMGTVIFFISLPGGAPAATAAKDISIAFWAAKGFPASYRFSYWADQRPSPPGTIQPSSGRPHGTAILNPSCTNLCILSPARIGPEYSIHPLSSLPSSCSPAMWKPTTQVHVYILIFFGPGGVRGPPAAPVIIFFLPGGHFHRGRPGYPESGRMGCHLPGLPNTPGGAPHVYHNDNFSVLTTVTSVHNVHACTQYMCLPQILYVCILHIVLYLMREFFHFSAKNDPSPLRGPNYFFNSRNQISKRVLHQFKKMAKQDHLSLLSSQFVVSLYTYLSHCIFITPPPPWRSQLHI